jgi:hypothetical protein
VNKRRSIETNEDLLRAFADFLEDPDPLTTEEIDAALCEAGYNPDEVGARIEISAKQALARSPLNWRNRARAEIEHQRERIATIQKEQSIAEAPRNKTSLVKAIEELAQTATRKVALAHRDLESHTEEDLATLLAELQFLVDEYNRPDSEE